MAPVKLIEVARLRGLDRVAVTDHNTIAGALAAARLAPDLIIIGEEIKTTQGELLAYFVADEVPRGLTPEETIRRLRDQGAVISVAHPFDRDRNGSWTPEALAEILPLVDALEVFNARVVSMAPNQQAAEAARQAGLPGTAGSDAHSAGELGRARLVMPPFASPEEFQTALASATVRGQLSSPWVHAFSRWAVLRKATGWERPADGS